MPRPKGHVRPYTEEQMLVAVDAVQKGMSVRNASQEFNIPKSTLMDRCSNRHKAKDGRPTVLIEEEETLIVERLQAGFYITSPNLICVRRFRT